MNCDRKRCLLDTKTSTDCHSRILAHSWCERAVSARNPDPAYRIMRSLAPSGTYLGHNDPGFTPRTHTHLVPSSLERARIAVDGVFPSAS